MMEEAQPTNTYIAQRGEAIEAIERTISELGGIFGNLATMVQEQSEMIQRIDANTEDVVGELFLNRDTPYTGEERGSQMNELK